MTIVISFALNAQKKEYADEFKNTGIYTLVRVSGSYNTDYEKKYNYNTNSYEKINTADGYGYGFDAMVGYFVIPTSLSLSLGFGINKYFDPDFKTAPLFLDIRYHIPFSDKRDSSFFVNLDIGTLLPIESSFQKGYALEAGIGGEFFMWDRFRMSVGLSWFTTHTVPKNDDGDIAIKGISLKLGAVVF